MSGGAGGDALNGVLGILGIGVGSAATYLGVRFTARQGRQAAEAAAKLARESADAATAVEARKADLAETEALWRRLDDQQKAIDGLKAREGEQHELLMHHAAWDFVVVTQLRAHGVTIDDPPPLTLPREG